MLKLIFLLLLLSCVEKSNERVIERYPGGEKKTVVTYIGQGNDEKLKSRFSYHVDGELLKIEDFEKNIVKNWTDLNPHYNNMSFDQFKKYFNDSWYVYIGDYDYFNSFIYYKIDLSPDSLKFNRKYYYVYKKDAPELMSDTIEIKPSKYLGKNIINMIAVNRSDAYHIIDYSHFVINSSKDTFKRVDRILIK